MAFPSLQNLNTIKYSPNPIKYPKGGIPREDLFNVDESQLLNLICPICFNLIWKAIGCYKCGGSFCEYCINELFKKRDIFALFVKQIHLKEEKQKYWMDFLIKLE